MVLGSDSALDRTKPDLDRHAVGDLPGRIVQDSRQTVAVDDQGRKKRCCKIVDFDLVLPGEAVGPIAGAHKLELPPLPLRVGTV